MRIRFPDTSQVTLLRPGFCLVHPKLLDNAKVHRIMSVYAWELIRPGDNKCFALSINDACSIGDSVMGYPQ